MKPYQPDEARRILATLAAGDDLSSAFDRAVVATLRWTGMRVAELTGLHRDRLDLDRRRAKVIGKGTKPRTVPLPRPLAAVRHDYLDRVRPACPPSPMVFANPRAIEGSEPYGGTATQGVRALCLRAGDRAGVD